MHARCSFPRRAFKAGRGLTINVRPANHSTFCSNLNPVHIMKIKAVVFDAYGTLFDVYSIQTLAEQFYPGQGAAISVMWRDKQIEYTRLITQSDPHQTEGSQYYLPFWEITQRSLLYTLDRLKLDSHGNAVDGLMKQYARLSPFPENLPVLESLKKAGLTTAILSNGSPEMLESAVANAGMGDLLDHCLSVDAVRLFKTSPESYGLVQKHMPHDKRDILFVSSNGWDALGATWFGFTTLWVNRQGLPYETIGLRPTYTGRDLSKVCEILGLS